ncbi:MAG: hypothetical protein F4Y57_06090 [Acidobacteria bacterium]|nr:hypothetical protein [Acidobacteriota bacterium]
MRLAGAGIVWSLALTVGLTGAGPDLRLVDAAARQDAATVRQLLADGADADTRRADGATALLWAAHWDDGETVRLLLDAGADVNAADDYGVTPLMRASENASAATVDMLLAAGADPNAAQASGLTALMVAARTGNIEVVRALMAYGADVNKTTNETAATALMWAVAAPHRIIVERLLEGGADVGVSTTKGMTPLLTAAQQGDIETARLLISAGADVNQPGADGTYPLPFAIVDGHDDFALFLIAQGADPNATIGGIPALAAAAGDTDAWSFHWDREHGGAQYAVRERAGGGRIYLTPAQRLPLVEALLAAGADPDARIGTSAMLMNYIGHPTKGAFESFSCGTGDLRGATPLWVAAHYANGQGYVPVPDAIDRMNAELQATIIERLLEAGADQSLTIDDGTTPLMAAAGLGQCTFRPNLRRGLRSHGAEAAVRVLLEAGADINAVNEADFNALHGAAYRGLNEVVEYLVANGADIDARDYRGRTAYRLAEGSKQSFQFQAFPETAELLAELGANTRLGVPGTVQERADRAVADEQVP